jgi:hypothetical protein
MALHPKFQAVVRLQHPTVIFGRDVLLVDLADGNGAQVVQWNLPGSPPTFQECETLAAQADANEIDLDKERQLNNITEAIFRALFNHENRIRTLAGQPQITAAQFRTGVKALLDD